MFDGHTPGDTVRCPVEGCEFSGTVRQVAAHAVDADDGDHDAVARGIERDRPVPEASDDADRTPVEAFVRLFEEAHGGSAGYESDRQGGWLFPFDDG